MYRGATTELINRVSVERVGRKNLVALINHKVGGFGGGIFRGVGSEYGLLGDNYQSRGTLRKLHQKLGLLCLVGKFV